MIRFFNGKVLTMDGDMSLSDGEVWTDGALISYVGPRREDSPVFEREIDLGGDLIMPGFKNAHAHSAMTFLRSFADTHLRASVPSILSPGTSLLRPSLLSSL